MDINNFFKQRREIILSVNPKFGFVHDGFIYVRYISTDQGEYKETEFGEVFKFNKGVIDQGARRWEEVTE